MDSDYKRGRLPATQSAEDMSAPKIDTEAISNFKTPEQVAAADSNGGPVVAHHDPDHDKPPKLPLKDRIKTYYLNNKRRCLIALALLILIIGIAGYLIFKPEQKTDKVTELKKTIKQVEKANTVPAKLTGLQVDPIANELPVTGVMIENSLEARPQAGLDQAGVVFEAIAEGGITRFLALFQDTAPDNIGPVRSARPYYVEWAMGFDANYAHVGGSPEALSNIRAWGVKDLDQFYNSGAYRRISERQAPHNVYTSIAALNQVATSKGLTKSVYDGFLRNLKDKPLKIPTAKSIDLDISGPSYNVHYDYNIQTNTYNRSEGGAPHIDANDNTQISPKVVIALATTYGIQSDGKHSQYGVVGSGEAYVFQDGGITKVNWTKATQKGQITFTDPAGQPFKLTPGKTWITVLDSISNVTSAP